MSSIRKFDFSCRKIYLQLAVNRQPGSRTGGSSRRLRPRVVHNIREYDSDIIRHNLFQIVSTHADSTFERNFILWTCPICFPHAWQIEIKISKLSADQIPLIDISVRSRITSNLMSKKQLFDMFRRMVDQHSTEMYIFHRIFNIVFTFWHLKIKISTMNPDQVQLIESSARLQRTSNMMSVKS